MPEGSRDLGAPQHWGASRRARAEAQEVTPARAGGALGGERPRAEKHHLSKTLFKIGMLGLDLGKRRFETDALIGSHHLMNAIKLARLGALGLSHTPVIWSRRLTALAGVLERKAA